MSDSMQRGLIVLVAVIACAALGALSAGHWYYAPKLTAAELRSSEADARSRQFESAYAQLAQVTQQQSAAIKTLHDESAARDAGARAAVKKAAAYGESLLAQARKIQAARTPAGADACTWARQQFDEELRAERGS